MAQLTRELDEIAKRSAAGSNGQTSAHAFSPREQIGKVRAISVSIGNEQEQPSVTDVQSIPTIPNSTIGASFSWLGANVQQARQEKKRFVRVINTTDELTRCGSPRRHIVPDGAAC